LALQFKNPPKAWESTLEREDNNETRKIKISAQGKTNRLNENIYTREETHACT